MNGDYQPEYQEMPMPPQDMYVPGGSNIPPLEAALIEKLDPKAVLEKLRHSLRGEEWDEESGNYIRKQKPMCDDELIHVLMMSAASVINQNTTMSDIDEIEIGRILFDLASTLITLLSQTADTHGVEYSNLDTIWTSICNEADMALKRGKNRGEMKALRTVIRSQEQVAVNPYQQEKKKKFLIFGNN